MAKRKFKPAPAARPAARGERTPPDWVSLGLAGLGLLITGYLSIVALSSSAPAFCAAGSDCDLVQQSRYAIFLGLPVAIWGFLTYALISLVIGLTRSRVKRWSRAFALAVIGLMVSLYLTAVGWFQLQALCLWCLTSLGVIASLTGWLAMTRPDSAPATPGPRYAANLVALCIAVLGLLLVDHGGLLSPRPDARLQALARHLDESGAKFYGASWCPNCQDQKDLFGGAAGDLPYIECSPNGRQGGFAIECVEAGIEGFPTWEIRGRRYVEVLQPEELAQRSAFDWKGFEEKATAD
ncbi:vitamin K epoxide reductase family protein [Pseudomarimonas salicorniae]|uniref:Vitamin K epoxide reductase domain-containing protein n=1 Tax=Pseudomarimonas salicorniae TaxID=2933270 RepID=A0ABT0GG62_9GAMM|nr:vitamin K epoxide reductase family protein [Lysobacter sp. CAU 1642]MCK7593526.1 hypothetical protein [Lysobacter sp. CAU 1642]